MIVRLLERGASLALLAGYAGEARQGDGRLVLIAGEAGVGKSALVEQFQYDLPDARWSWGACDGLFTPRPLGPLFDIADQLGGELLDLCRARAGRDELFGALLRQVSEPGMLDVVVVEDVHWADEATGPAAPLPAGTTRHPDVPGTREHQMTLFMDPHEDLKLTPSTPVTGGAPLGWWRVGSSGDRCRPGAPRRRF